MCFVPGRFAVLTSLVDPLAVWAVPLCPIYGDPYISRIPTEKLMSQLSEEDTQCYSHVPLDGVSISERPDPTVWGRNSSYYAGESSGTCTASSVDLLTQEQLDYYDSHGFLYLPNLFHSEKVTRWRYMIDSVSSQLSPQKAEDREGSNQEQNVTVHGKRMNVKYIMEPRGPGEKPTIKTIKGFLDDMMDGEKRELHWSPALARKVEQILGSKVYIVQSRLNFQHPFSGVGFNWHSDFETWHNEDGMPKPRCVSAIIAFDNMTEFNGPWMAIPGSHKHFVHTFQDSLHNGDNYKTSLSHQYLGSPQQQQLTWLFKRAESEFEQGIHVGKMGSGGVFLFDCNTMHGSPNNISPIGRRTAFVIFNSVDNIHKDKPYANQHTHVRPQHLAGRGVVEPIV